MNNEKGKKNSREVPENTVYIHAKVVETNFFLSMGNWKKKKIAIKNSYHSYHWIKKHSVFWVVVIFNWRFVWNYIKEIWKKKIETFHEWGRKTSK